MLRSALFSIIHQHRADDFTSPPSTYGTLVRGGQISGTCEASADSADSDWFKVSLSADNFYRFTLSRSAAGYWGRYHSMFIQGSRQPVVHHVRHHCEKQPWQQQLDGGAGIDTVIYANQRAFHDIANSTTETRVSDQNVLHRAGEQAGVAYWNKVLADGTARADVPAFFSEGPENQAAVLQVIGNGFEYPPYG